MASSFATRYRVNGRFLVRLLLLSAVVGVGLYFAHRYQSKKLVDAYHTQAERAKEAGALDKEMTYLRRYLALRPDDTTARVRYGTLQYRFARRPQERLQAYLSLQDAIRTDPNVAPVVRFQAAKIALHPSIGMATDARRELDALLKTDAMNAEYEELYADSHLIAREYKEADSWLSRVVNHDKTRVDAYAKQAYIRRVFFRRTPDAAAVIEAMVAANPNSPAARLNAADFWRSAGQPAKAAEQVRAAQAIAPDNLEVVVAASELTLSEAREIGRRGMRDEANAKANEATGRLTAALEKALTTLPPRDPPPEPGSPEERAVAVAGQAFRTLIGTLALTNKPADAERWARKEVELFPDAAAARLGLIDALILKGSLPEAETMLNALDRAGFPGPAVDLHRGRIAVVRGQWVDAAELLRRATAGVSQGSPLARQGHALLAECYRHTGEPDRRYESLVKAVPADALDPTWVPAVAGVADALADLGKLTDAIAEYRRLAPTVPGVHLPLARLMLADALRQPAERRNLAPVEQELALVPAGPQVELLKAELAAARGQAEAALEGLEKAIDRTPGDIGLWAARVLLLAPRDRQKADEVLSLAVKRFGDTPEIRLLKLRLLMASGGKPSAEQLAALGNGLDAMTPADRGRLLGPLLGAALRFNHRDLARPWADKLTADRPTDLGVLFQRFDLALVEKDRPTLDRLAARAAEIAGGPKAAAARVARAFALMTAARTGDATGLAEANELLTGLEQERAGWPRLYVAQAQVSELLGDRTAAARRYRKAVDLGERDPAVVDRLLELYTVTRQFDEAEKLFKMVPEARAALKTPDAAQAELFAGTKDFKAAAEAAERAVPADSSDAGKLLWKARLLLQCGATEGAEKALRRATTVAPDRPEVWVGLAQLLAATNRAAGVAAVVEQARGKLNPADAGLTAAQCFELAGDLARAAVEYDALLKARTDLPAMKAAAGFKMRVGDRPAARGLYEQVLKFQERTPEDDKFARRMIALCLAADRDPAKVKQAMEVLGLADIDKAAELTEGLPPDELRARAMVLAAQQGRRAKASAIRLMVAVKDKVPLTGDDHLLVARLHQRLGDWPNAKTHYQLAAAAADAWVERAAAQAPKSPATFELQARLAAAEGKLDQAVLLSDQAEAAAGRPGLAAVLLEQFGQHPQAEAAYRRFAAGDPKKELPLAAFLGRRGRTTDALAVFGRVVIALPPEVYVPALTQAAVDTNGLASPAETDRLVKWVEAGAEKVPQLVVYVAAIKSLAGDYPAAEAISRRVLATDPSNLVALNNLAFLLSVKDGKHAEALELVRRAITVAGPLPTLLDTEAVILTAANNPDAAIDRLTEASADEPTAVVFTHLAQAYMKANKRTDALAAFGEAKKRNLREFDFHPLEWPGVRALKQTLGTQ